MPDVPLTIKMLLDNAASRAATAAQVAAFRQVVAAADQAAKAEQGAIDRVAQLRDSAAGRFIKAGQAAAASAVGGFKQVTTAAGLLDSALGTFAGRIATFGALVGAIRLVTGAFDAARDAAFRAAQAAHDFDKASRMGATLEGKTTEQARADKLKFMLQTTLGEKEADEFNRQFEGSLPIGIQKGNITRDVADKLKIQAGIKAAREGAAPGTAGDLAGILGQFGQVKSVEAGLGQIEAIRQGLTEGRGDDPVLTAQLLKVAGSLVKEGGTVGSLPELAAMIGVTSLSAGPEEAGTRMQQAVRAMRSGLVKQRKMKGADLSQADYLKQQVGIGEKDTATQMFDKLFADLEKAEAGGRDLDVYLGEKGFGSFEERRALVEIYENRGAARQRVERAKAGAGGGADVLAKNREFLKGRLGTEAYAEVREQAADVLAGEKYRDVKALTQMESGEQKQYDQSGGTQFLDIFRGLTRGSLDPATGRKERVEQALRDRLAKQAGAMGVMPKVIEQMGGAVSTTDYLRILAEQIRGAGGDPFSTYGGVESELGLGAPGGGAGAGGGGEGGPIPGKLDQQTVILGEIRDSLQKGGTMPLAGRPVAGQ